MSISSISSCSSASSSYSSSSSLACDAFGLEYKSTLPASSTCFVGISMGKTPLMIAGNTRLLVLDLIGRGFTDILLVLGDEINMFNIHAFERKSIKSGIARGLALERGQCAYDMITEELSGLERFARVVRWSDIHDAKYQGAIDAMIDESTIPGSPLTPILESWTKTFVALRKPLMTVTPEKAQSLQSYLLWELPLLTKGVTYNGVHYSDMVYPAFAGEIRGVTICAMATARESIMDSPAFAHLWDKLGAIYHPGRGTFTKIVYRPQME